MFQLGNRLWHTDSSFKRLPALALAALRALDRAGRRPHRVRRRARGLRRAARGHEAPARWRWWPSIRSSPRARGSASPTSTTRSGASCRRCRRWWCARCRESGRKSLYLASHAGPHPRHARGRGPRPDRRADRARDAAPVRLHPPLARRTTSSMWDNRCTMHRGTDFDDLRWKRDMQRATVCDSPIPASRKASPSPLPRARMTETFETALSARVAAMADACTRCGKCVEVCPVTGPGGVKAEPVAVISGIIDILRTGDGPEASRKWANACVLSGECIKACDYGVNPRFMLNMARVQMAQHANARRSSAAAASKASARSRARCSTFRACSSTTRCWSGSARSPTTARARRAAGFRVLHRLQRAQDPAHRAARARHHGCARHHLQGDGRADPLLRRRADAHRRRRDLRPLRAKPPWTSSPPARPRRCWPGARAATPSSPRPRCRRSRRRAAQSRSR